MGARLQARLETETHNRAADLVPTFRELFQ